MSVELEKKKYEEMVDTYVVGNITIFKNWLKKCKKIDMLHAIEYYTANYGKRHQIISSMEIYLE